MSRWKLKIEKTDLGSTLILADDLLEKLGVGLGDQLTFVPLARGFVMKKAPDKESPDKYRK